MKSLNVWEVQKSFSSFLKTMHGKRKKKTKEPHSSTEINTTSLSLDQEWHLVVDIQKTLHHFTILLLWPRIFFQMSEVLQ